MPKPSGDEARLSRRGALRFALCGTALLFGGGHAPYGQWGVYRKRHLLILAARTDPTSYELAERLVAVLADKLPESRAQAVRAPHNERIASLISSKQMDLALMRRGDAAALLKGVALFAEYGPAPLRTIVGLGDYLLVCRDDFPARHAWLVAEALSNARDALSPTPSTSAAEAEAPGEPVPFHVGAQTYFAGGPLPDHEPGHDDRQHLAAPDAAR